MSGFHCKVFFNEGIVDRACILHDGRMLMSGTVAEVVADPDVRRVYLGDSFTVA